MKLKARLFGDKGRGTLESWNLLPLPPRGHLGQTLPECFGTKFEGCDKTLVFSQLRLKKTLYYYYYYHRCRYHCLWRVPIGFSANFPPRIAVRLSSPVRHRIISVFVLSFLLVLGSILNFVSLPLFSHTDECMYITYVYS